MTPRCIRFLFLFLILLGLGTHAGHGQQFFLELKGVLEAEDGPIKVYIEVGEKGQTRQLVKLKKDGSFFIELDLNQDYEFFVRADGYQPQLVKLNTRTSDETIEAGLKPLDFNIYMAKIPEELLKEQKEKEEKGEEKEEIAPVVSNVSYNKETGQFAFKQEYMKSVEGQRQAAAERKVQQIAQLEQRKEAQALQKEHLEKNKAEIAAANAEKARVQEENRLKEKQRQDSIEVARRAEQARRDAQLAELARQRELEAAKEKARLDSIQAAVLLAKEQARQRQNDSLNALAQVQAQVLEKARLEALRIKDSVDEARLRERARVDSLLAAKVEEKRIREEEEKAKQEALAQAKANEASKLKREEEARRLADQLERARQDSLGQALLLKKAAKEQELERRKRSIADSIALVKEQQSLRAKEEQRQYDQLAAKQRDSLLQAQADKARMDAAEKAKREQLAKQRQDSIQQAQLDALKSLEKEQARVELQEKLRQDSIIMARIEQKRKEDEFRRQQALAMQARQDSIQRAGRIAQQQQDEVLRLQKIEKARQDSIRQFELTQQRKEEENNPGISPAKKRIIDNNIRIFKTVEERTEVVSASERAALISRLVVTLKKYDVEELELSEAFGFINFGDGSGNIEVNEREFYRYRRLFFR